MGIKREAWCEILMSLCEYWGITSVWQHFFCSCGNERIIVTVSIFWLSVRLCFCFPCGQRVKYFRIECISKSRNHSHCYFTDPRFLMQLKRCCYRVEIPGISHLPKLFPWNARWQKLSRKMTNRYFSFILAQRLGKWWNLLNYSCDICWFYIGCRTPYPVLRDYCYVAIGIH